LAATVLMTHRLIGVVPSSESGAAGQNRHPTLVQSRLLPVWVEVRLVRVRLVPLHEATPVSELPMSGTWNGSGTPGTAAAGCRAAAGEVLQQDAGAGLQRAAVAGPMLVVKFSALGFGEKPQQAARVVWSRSTSSWWWSTES